MYKEFKEWLKWLGIENPVLHALDGDASSRAYYRLEAYKMRGMLMDASRVKESVPVFIGVAQRLSDAGVRIPAVKSFELDKGFVFLEDVGSTHLFDKRGQASVAGYYDKAIETLVGMQKTSVQGLSVYDEAFLLEEMSLMPQWYLGAHLDHTLLEEDKKRLSEGFAVICKEVLSQPQEIFVHRDYHARNLMIDANEEIVVIDFQDAKVGALTYDLVSLLRDAYVYLDPNEVQRLALRFRDLKGLQVSDEQFMRWVDFMGLQRHIKILGIFARLDIRDGKNGYLKDIPLVLRYIKEVGSRYAELEGLLSVLP